MKGRRRPATRTRFLLDPNDDIPELDADSQTTLSSTEGSENALTDSEEATASSTRGIAVLVAVAVLLAALVSSLTTLLVVGPHRSSEDHDGGHLEEPPLQAGVVLSVRTFSSYFS